MPLLLLKEISATTRLAIWEITEPHEFFLRVVPMPANIKHPHKQLQHLAGRYLLQYLFPDFPISAILIAETRKPFLENEAYHFSISHSGNYAAAIVSTTHRIGIDIEPQRQKIAQVAHKFLSHQERAMVEHLLAKQSHKQEITNTLSIDNGNQPPALPFSYTKLSLLTLLWCAKEAIYKWWGKGSVDFANMIQIDHIELSEPNVAQDSIELKTSEHTSSLSLAIMQARFCKDREVFPLQLHYEILTKISLVWLVSATRH